jgi:hypothetical protein
LLGWFEPEDGRDVFLRNIRSLSTTKLEGRGFETRWGEFLLNLTRPSGRTRLWGSLSLYQKLVPETEK